MTSLKITLGSTMSWLFAAAAAGGRADTEAGRADERHRRASSMKVPMIELYRRWNPARPQ
jgi:hypothetical protein